MGYEYDIAEVCTMLGTTSRTLRFYEEKGLIESTVVPPSNRRRYTEAQLDTIKKVLSLRALDLPIKELQRLKNQQKNLKDIIKLHRADILRVIGEKYAQVNLLEEVLHHMEKEENTDFKTEIVSIEEQAHIADICTNALLQGNFDICVSYFDDNLKKLLSASALEHAFHLTIQPLGAFIEILPAERLQNMPNVLLHPLRYEHMTVMLKYVFHQNELCGLWMEYRGQ